METEEKEPIGMNASEKTNLDFSNSKETVTRELIEGTPFTMKWEEGKGYQLGLAEYALTEFKETREEIVDMIENGTNDWNLLITIIGSLIDLTSRFQNLEKTQENGNN